MQQPRNYIVCASGRTGSTLLCRTLAQLGNLGHPREYLLQLDKWLQGQAADAILSERLRLLAERYRSANGVFGMKALRPQWREMMESLAGERGCRGDDAETVAAMQAIFGNPVFIYLRRKDKAAQAVSLMIALETGEWHRDAGTPSAGAALPVPYDFERIAAAVRTFEREEREWSAWFRRHKLSPVILSYESLTSRFQVELERILAALGCSPPTRPLEMPLAPTAHPAAAELLNRYRADRLSGRGRAADVKRLLASGLRTLTLSTRPFLKQ